MKTCSPGESLIDSLPRLATRMKKPFILFVTTIQRINLDAHESSYALLGMIQPNSNFPH